MRSDPRERFANFPQWLIVPPMPAILEIPEVRGRVVPLPVEAYHRMIEEGLAGRVELIEGIIIEKMGKSPLHTRLSHRLFEMLRTRLGDGFWVRLEAPLCFESQRSEPEPDLSVVRGSDRQYADAHPSTALLVVEVAVSSVEADRNMATLYATAGVAEYWIVRGREEIVEVYSGPVSGKYTVHRNVGRTERLISSACPSVELEMEALFGA